MVAFENGDYLLVDPLTANIKSYSLGEKFKELRLLEVKTYDNGFVLRT